MAYFFLNIYEHLSFALMLVVIKFMYSYSFPS